MDCRHCGASFGNRNDLKSHLAGHADIQKRVYPSRTYGAVYQSAPARAVGTPTANGSLVGHEHQTDERPAVEARDPELNYPCRLCSVTFKTRELAREHERSPNCEGQNIVCWVLIVDTYQPTGYRIEERYLPFSGSGNAYQFLFKCRKCNLTYASEEDCELHCNTHVNENQPCEHCGKTFGTQHELHVHYDWHWDVQWDHNIEMASFYQGPDAIDEGRTEEEIPSVASSLTKKPTFLRNDGEIIAISFVSASDLRMAFTSLKTGKLSQFRIDGMPSASLFVDNEDHSFLPQRGAMLNSHIRYLDPTNYTMFLKEHQKGKAPANPWYSTNKAYKDWQDPASDSSLLWLQGPIGCGKSAHAAGIVERCLDLCIEPGNDIAVIYFFFDEVTEDRRTVSSFLRTVIAQLYTQRPELSARIPLKHIPLLEGVPLDHLWATMQNLLSCFASTYCIVDGVDIVQTSELTGGILALHSIPSIKIKTLVTSRSHPEDDLFSNSKTRWVELTMPLDAISRNLEVFRDEMLQGQTTVSHPSNTQSAKPTLEHREADLKDHSVPSFYYITIAKHIHLDMLDRVFPNGLDELLSMITKRLADNPPFFRDYAYQILRWMIVSPATLSIGDLDFLLSLGRSPVDRITTQGIIQSYLRGLVNPPDSKGHVCFTAPPVRSYLISGTADTSCLTGNSARSQPVLPLKKAYRESAVDLLRYMASTRFAFHFDLQSLQSAPGLEALELIKSRWVWFVARTPPTAEIISLLNVLLETSHCKEWLASLSRQNPSLATRQVYDVELEKWLQRAQPIDGISLTKSHLTRYRKIVLDQIGNAIPANPEEVVRVFNCLGQLHIACQLAGTAEELFRECLRVTSMWHIPEFGEEAPPDIVLGHTIDRGQLLTVKDVRGRMKAVTIVADLLFQTQFLTDSDQLRRQLLSELRRMEQFESHNLHKEAARVYQKVKPQLDQIRWDGGTVEDSVIALKSLLWEQGHNSKISSVLSSTIPAIKTKRSLLFTCCEFAATPDPALTMRLVEERIHSLGSSRGAILAIQRLGTYYLERNEAHLAIYCYESAYRQSQAQHGPDDPLTFLCIKGLIAAYLATVNWNAISQLLTEVESLSPSQLKELTPAYPPSKMNFANLLWQLGLGKLATTVIEELEVWLRSQDVSDEDSMQQKEAQSVVATNVAAIRIREGQTTEGEYLLRRVLADPRGLAGHQIKSAKTKLVEALRLQGRSSEAAILQAEIDADGLGYGGRAGGRPMW